jgi:hypothetical protein
MVKRKATAVKVIRMPMRDDRETARGANLSAIVLVSAFLGPLVLTPQTEAKERHRTRATQSWIGSLSLRGADGSYTFIPAPPANYSQEGYRATLHCPPSNRTQVCMWY